MGLENGVNTEISNPTGESAAVKTNDALANIPFEHLIGSPLSACVEAQAQAACATANFIQSVGLCAKKTKTKQEGAETHEEQYEAVTVEFSFMRGGNEVIVKVPLLTIVPIPYFAISTVDINFKANISASSSSVSETSSSDTIDAGGEAKGRIGWGPFKLDASMKANYSSKKDSKATQSSQYSVEYTMDVAVKAGQDSMPAGMAKVLEILSNAMSVESPKGTLEVNSQNFIVDGNQSAKLIATFKNGNGLYEPKAIKIDGKTATIDGDNAVFELPTGTYTIKAGENEVTVKVANDNDGGNKSKKDNAA